MDLQLRRWLSDISNCTVAWLLSGSVLAVAGCTGHGGTAPKGGSADSRSSSPTAVFDSGAPVRTRQLEDLARLTSDDDRVVWAAGERYMQVCLEHQGYEYIAELYPDGGDDSAFRLLYPPEDAVAQYGYDWRARTLPTPPPPHTVVSKGQVFQDGNPISDACGEQRAQALQREDFVRAQDIFLVASETIRQEALVSGEVQKTVGLWHQCMTDRGFSFKDPLEANQTAFTAGSHTESISIADADFSCQRRVKFAETVDGYIEVQSRVWIEAHPTAVADFQVASSKYVAIAQMYLDNNPE
jgi:hypothetical protein